MTAAKKPRKQKSNRLRKWTTGVEGMDRLLQDKAMSHNRGFFHYTILRHLAKILTPVEIGGKKCHLMKMSPAENLNDRAEKRSGNKAYVLSLLHGPEESVAMWTVYGVPKKEAVRIRLPKKAVAAWWKKTKKDCSSVFFVRQGQEEKARYKAVEPARIRFADVLYVVRKDSTFPYIAEHDGVLYGAPDKQSWGDFAATKPDVGLDLFFKNRGWAHERETRLVVEFKNSPAKIGESIYVDFTKVLGAMLATNRSSSQTPSKNILLGPWFDETWFENGSGKSTEQIHGLSSLKQVVNCNNLSLYRGELIMPTNCNYCDQRNHEQHCKGNGKRCNCPYKGQ